MLPLPFFLLALALAATPLSVKAQNTGRLTGRVVSISGWPVPGAIVILEGTQLGALTDIDGTYFIIGVPAGEYDVRITAPVSVEENPAADSDSNCLARGVVSEAGFTTFTDFLFEEGGHDGVIECRVVSPPLSGIGRPPIGLEEDMNLPIMGMVNSSCYQCSPGTVWSGVVLCDEELRSLDGLLVIYDPVGVE